MNKLGDKVGCQKKLQGLLDFASSHLNSDEPIGFFTSRPAITVFDDDPKMQNQIDCNYLIGLAHKGLGAPGKARRAFEAVLALDPHHWEAAVELQALSNSKNGE
jgi:hypothetical protein